MIFFLWSDTHASTKLAKDLFYLRLMLSSFLKLCFMWVISFTCSCRRALKFEEGVLAQHKLSFSLHSIHTKKSYIHAQSVNITNIMSYIHALYSCSKSQKSLIYKLKVYDILSMN